MALNSGIIAIDAIGFSVTIIDIAVVLFVLIMGIIGRCRGFVKILFSLCGTLAVIIGSVLLASTVGNFLANTIGHVVQNPITDWMLGSQTEGGVKIFTDVYNWGDETVRSQQLPLALSMLGLPATISGILVDTGLFNGMLAEAGSAKLIDVLPAAFTSIIMTIVAFVILLIVLTIVVHLLKKFFVGLSEYRLFGWANKLLGFVFGIAQAYLIVSVLLTVVAYIPAGGLMTTIQQQIDASIITKFLVENNWIGNWLLANVLPH